MRLPVPTPLAADVAADAPGPGQWEGCYSSLQLLSANNNFLTANNNFDGQTLQNICGTVGLWDHGTLEQAGLSVSWQIPSILRTPSTAPASFCFSGLPQGFCFSS